MSSVREFTIKTYYEREVALDDDGEGQTIPVRIRRFTVAQLQAFLPGFERMVSPPSERVVYRRPEGDEQVQDEQRRYLVPFAEVRRRRLAEMTAEQRAAFDAAAREDQDAILAFCRSVIAEHVWLPPGVVLRIEQDDGYVVTASKGPELAAVFEGNLMTLMALTRAVADENMVGAEAKKAWRSSSSSRPSSSGLPAPGGRPAPTAAAAGRKASARPGRVSGSRRPHRSGSAAT